MKNTCLMSTAKGTFANDGCYNYITAQVLKKIGTASL